MPKNIDTLNSEFSASLITLINESKLPACLIRLNLQSAISQIANIEKSSIAENLENLEKKEGAE